MKTTLLKGDCLEVMKDIPDKSVDMILCDLPYGTTACKWDNVIPFKPMWEQLNRIIKENGAIVLFGSEPFSSYLRMSNIKHYKYDWVWNKKKAGNFMLAKYQPQKIHENIIVFNEKRKFFPIMEKGQYRKKGTSKKRIYSNTILGDIKLKESKNDLYYPKSIIEISNAIRINKVHPTQKPVPLLEYLIKTYTLENETVLDFTMGSGSTGVACVNTNRNFIGIELDEKYFEIAKDRIEQTKNGWLF